VNITGLLDALASHAQATGLIEVTTTHEPKNAPGQGITAALWVQRIAPVPAGSGLAETTGVVTFTLRFYSNMLQEPLDAIDPAIVQAVDAMMTAYTGDFTLGGSIRNIDLLGATGEALSARAGYLNVGGKYFRIMDVTIPCIVNDLWSQAP